MTCGADFHSSAYTGEVKAVKILGGLALNDVSLLTPTTWEILTNMSLKGW